MDNEFLPDLYELEDENGNKQTFELLDAMEYGDEKYYALTPYYENGDEALEDSGDVVILKAEYDENNDEILASIEDDDEYEKIGQMFMERIDEMFEFDDEDEDDDCGCGRGLSRSPVIRKISQHIGLSICKMYNFMYFDLLKLPIDIMDML